MAVVHSKKKRLGSPPLRRLANQRKTSNGLGGGPTTLRSSRRVTSSRRAAVVPETDSEAKSTKPSSHFHPSKPPHVLPVQLPTALAAAGNVGLRVLSPLQGTGLRQRSAAVECIARDPNIDASGPSAPYGIPAELFPRHALGCSRPSHHRNLNMICPCGSDCTALSHQVKTLQVAQEWSSLVQEQDLPVRIEQDRCKACGRQRTRVFTDNPHRMIESRG